MKGKKEEETKKEDDKTKQNLAKIISKTRIFKEKNIRKRKEIPTAKRNLISSASKLTFLLDS